MSKDLKEYIVRKRYSRVEECFVMAKDWEDAEARAWSDINFEDVDSSGVHAPLDVVLKKMHYKSISSPLNWEYLDDNLDIEVEEI